MDTGSMLYVVSDSKWVCESKKVYYKLIKYNIFGWIKIILSTFIGASAIDGSIIWSLSKRKKTNKMKTYIINFLINKKKLFVANL